MTFWNNTGNVFFMAPELDNALIVFAEHRYCPLRAVARLAPLGRVVVARLFLTPPPPCDPPPLLVDGESLPFGSDSWTGDNIGLLSVEQVRLDGSQPVVSFEGENRGWAVGGAGWKQTFCLSPIVNYEERPLV